MAEELRYIKREIEKGLARFRALQRRAYRLEMKMKKETEEERINKLKEELKKSCPNIEFTPRTLRLLRLVGTQPYIPLNREKEVIAEVIAEHYE
ncbi:MAG: hypothetical protein H3Z54_09835 [archaeon]|nr:hypothetical protein [archaeon]MCP8316357.1 hypothetical protein [archaeon]